MTLVCLCPNVRAQVMSAPQAVGHKADHRFDPPIFGGWDGCGLCRPLSRTKTPFRRDQVFCPHTADTGHLV